MPSIAAAGVRNGCLVVNLSGIPKAVKENIEAILDAIPQAVEKIKSSEERSR